MEVRRRDRLVPFVTKDRSIIREIMHPRNSRIKNQSLAEATVKPGEATLEHRHLRSEEIYYILRGKGRVKVGGEHREVEKYDAILIPPNTSHSIENTGSGDLVFLCCSAPAYSDDDVLLEDEKG
jgi:mannose-6-phosphate isomerase-like protein (cupin superfamily)